ncbi:HFL169Cp [Eremothecium sinecaudum]|uniref:HFL169Cp n=1 Tax=Eremothecium sinecaudum TaxID=45286 RepID=A0A0X8HUG1_9SACH|nr:HFL169Cp [Eremothecium sinecaudum]AMD21687.1 HFL169Cp [Eremothecium sinecaudum]
MHNQQLKALEGDAVTDSLPVVIGNNGHKDVNIPHGSDDMSTYSKFLTIYSRCPETYMLYNAEVKQNTNFDTKWDEFAAVLKNTKGVKNSNCIVEYMIPSSEAEKFIGISGVAIKVSEYVKDGEEQVRGAVTTVENENEFNDWFIWHILDQARLDNSALPKRNIAVTEGKDYAKMVTDFFASELKNAIKEDEWGLGGYEYFMNRVKYYTDRNARIEAVLPAFPCKSSNMQKVNGKLPDKGEEFALRTLLKFAEDVCAFYPPGMKVWIVSDGHVFSDCIGVDDDEVDNFTANLHKLYKGIAKKDNNMIGFYGLKDVFFNGAAAGKFDTNWVSDVEVDHYCGTKICPDSELCRKILIKGCDTDDGRLRKQIEIPDHPRLHLYRGFSRFMAEDLCLLPFFQNVSRKYFKKAVCKVAFNMIKRNDAYSNLVELVFPHHLRLSIHAHTNAGPKFGVKVVSPKICKTVKSLDSDDVPTFDDLLHIPTPWHNCVVRIGDDYYLAKNKVVTDALESGRYKGEWKEGDISRGEGGHWVINRV